MKKSKLMVFVVLSIFCLNSCLSSTYFIGSLLNETGISSSIPSVKSPIGIETIYNKDKEKFRNYINNLNLRENVRLKLSENISVNVPKDIILKKDGNTKYFYDNKEKVGLGISIYYKESNSYLKENDIIKTVGKVEIMKSKLGNNKSLFYKISDNIYLRTFFYEEFSDTKEYYDFIINFINNLEKVK